MRINCETAAKRLLSADKIAIIAHRSPDGDTLGSAYALYYALVNLGKTAKILCSDPLPPQFSYLAASYEAAEFEEEFVTAVDVASSELLGVNLQQYADKVDLCIDHHHTNSGYAKETYVEGKWAAACELVYGVIRAMNAPVTPLIASCLYTGIATDTGCFKYPSTSANTHRIAADLTEAGADYARINRELFDTKSKARVKIEQAVLESLGYAADGAIAYVCVTQQMLKESGAVESELDGVAAIPRMIEGVEIGITFREQTDGTFKVSIRTAQFADASAICAKFGGGGHVRAAGCRFSCGYEEALKSLLAAAESELK